jgi:hypothetical protein
MESIMEKRNAVEAVYAESLVFESDAGPATVAATHPGSEAIKRVQWIPAWRAAALACENVGVSESTTPPSTH